MGYPVVTLTKQGNHIKKGMRVSFRVLSEKVYHGEVRRIPDSDKKQAMILCDDGEIIAMEPQDLDTEKP